MKSFKLILFFFFGGIFGLFSQGFYDVNTINTIEIHFPYSNWDYKLDSLVNYSDEGRLLGSVTINGQDFDSVGVRYKGNSSYNANNVKNPFNIKLDYVINDQEIDGYGTIKLSNVYKDPSFVREVLGYEIARQYIPASQSNFSNVYVNGTLIGLYTSNQDVDKYFMRTHFSSDENARIKGELAASLPPGQMGGVWQYFGQDSSSYYSKYALESDFGWQDLVGFLDTLNNYNASIENVLNVDRHLWFLAFENLLVNLDSPINNPQNYYIYKDDVGRFNPIPWDLNECFGVFTSLQSGGQLSTTQLQQLSPFVNLTNTSYPVISKVLTNAKYRKIYVAHMKTMIAENFANGAYLTRANEIQGVIAASVQADPNKFYTYSNFVSNVNTAVGSGPNNVIGIAQLMNARISYIQNLTDFQYQAPQIASVSHWPETVAANSEVWFNTTVSNASTVELAYRYGVNNKFNKVAMFDDGNHQDGQANDGIYGCSLMVGSVNMQYFVYAENQTAAAFLPEKAEYEFYNMSITASLVINEFMADNKTAVVDQDGQYDDWIEIFNNSSDAINLNGYYLSDNASNPTKWMFPDTIISAGGYLVVWADNDLTQIGLHASFKLSTSGEVVALSDNNANLIDFIDFGQQKSDTTTGRYPNGTGDFMEMLPTFGAENNGDITAVSEIIPSAIDVQLNQNYPNPFRDETTINFSIGQTAAVNLNIYDVYGKLVKVLVSEQLSTGEYSYKWQAENVPAGVYICLLSVDNQIQLKKVAIKM